MATEKKKTNPILFILFAIVISLITVVAIVIIALTFTDDSKIKELPFIGALINSENEDKLKETLNQTKEKNKAQKQEITELKKEVASLEDIVSTLEIELKKSKNKEATEEKLNRSAEEASIETNEEVSEIAGAFRNMDPVKAAAIIEKLKTEVAMEVMEHISSKVQGNILAEMDPEKAAALMTKIAEK